MFVYIDMFYAEGSVLSLFTVAEFAAIMYVIVIYHSYVLFHCCCVSLHNDTIAINIAHIQ